MSRLTIILILLPSLLHAAELPGYSVSWIGNTFSGGDAGWVPQDVEDIFVTPDGTVYTNVPWEEHRGNVAAFKEGKLIQQSAHWKNGGIDRLVGNTIAANGRYIFFGTDKSRHLARRDRADITSKRLEKRAMAGQEIQGVAATEERVFIACADGRVRVFDVELAPLGEFTAPSPGEMCIDRQGHLWIIDTAGRAVGRFDADGKRLPQRIDLPEGVIPTDVAITPDNRLLVADAGVAQQVRIYRDIDTAPRLDGTFGETGGVYAGPVPGRFGDRRFIAPIGVGADSAGNIYVACGMYQKTQGGTAIIQSYAPDGKLNWRVMSTEWLNTVDADESADGAVLYGVKYQYTLDLAKPAGQQWTLAALTLDRHRYPDDPRLASGARGGVWHRLIAGRRYLYFTDMNGGNMYVCRFDPEKAGEIAVPCGHISTKAIWIDQNGDGRRDEAEVVSRPDTGESRGWDVQGDGTIWHATLGKGIYQYPMEGVVAGGVPAYRIAGARHHPMPAPFTQLRRIAYDAKADAMYLGGSTADAKADHWKPMGPNLARYDHWSKQPKLAWHQVLPHEKAKGGHSSYEPFDLAAEGDHLFVVYAGKLPSQNLPWGTVMVFTKAGEYLGHMQPSGERNGLVPMDALQDIVHSINVHRRSDGEYLVFIEDDGYTKNVMYRWKP